MWIEIGQSEKRLLIVVVVTKISAGIVSILNIQVENPYPKFYNQCPLSFPYVVDTEPSIA